VFLLISFGTYILEEENKAPDMLSISDIPLYLLFERPINIRFWYIFNAAVFHAHMTQFYISYLKKKM
jgi:hypothetical protein